MKIPDHSGVVYHPNFLVKYFETHANMLGSDKLATLWNEHGFSFAVYKANMTFQDGVEFAGDLRHPNLFELDGKYTKRYKQTRSVA